MFPFSNKKAYEITGDLTGKTIIVTGSSSGIGKIAAQRLAEKGAHIIMANRSGEKTKPILEGIIAAGGSAEFMKVDVSDMDSVRNFVKAYQESGRPIHVLINNAGVVLAGVTKEGYDISFATNHLGPFLLTLLLLPILARSGSDVRIVNVASKAHEIPSIMDYEFLYGSKVAKEASNITAFRRYGESKLCNVWHANYLTKKLQGTSITANSLHPGVINTGIWRESAFASFLARLFLTPEEQGADTLLYCATDPAMKGISGKYFDECKEAKMSPLASNEDMAADCWSRSLALLQEVDYFQ